METTKDVSVMLNLRGMCRDAQRGKGESEWKGGGIVAKVAGDEDECGEL